MPGKVVALVPLLLVLLALGRLRLPVVVLGLPGGGVRVAVLEAAEPRLLPGQVLLRTRPGTGLRALLLMLLVFGVGGADVRQSVVAGRPVPVTVVGVVLPGIARIVVLRALVAGRLLLCEGSLWARGLAYGIVDGDSDPDRAAALTAEGLADQRGEPAFQDALAPLVGDGEECGVGHQCEWLAALDPLLVLGLDALLALCEELFQHSWPHCGKIGRYVSHKARSLTGPCPTNVWFSGRDGKTGRK